jgi:hypothetical protein
VEKLASTPSEPSGREPEQSEGGGGNRLGTGTGTEFAASRRRIMVGTRRFELRTPCTPFRIWPFFEFRLVPQSWANVS